MPGDCARDIHDWFGSGPSKSQPSKSRPQPYGYALQARPASVDTRLGTRFLRDEKEVPLRQRQRSFHFLTRHRCTVHAERPRESCRRTALEFSREHHSNGAILRCARATHPARTRTPTRTRTDAHPRGSVDVRTLPTKLMANTLTQLASSTVLRVAPWHRLDALAWSVSTRESSER